MNTMINDNHFIFTTTNTPPGKEITTSSKVTIKTEINVKVGERTTSATDFFRNIGCLSTNDTIDMLKLNKIKQYLDMIKDGTSSNLLKKLKVFAFTDNQGVIQNVTYPNTLDAIKDYFNQHYKKEGKTTNVFWPRHGEYSNYLRDDEVAFHDCGFKPDLCIVKGPPDYIDPLAHGPFQPATDLVFPDEGKTITWSSETLQSVGFPPGCEIKATNTAAAGSPPVWNIEIICQNEGRGVDALRVRVTNDGIFKAAAAAGAGAGAGGALTTQVTGIKGVKGLEEMTRGNAFKSLIQKEASDKSVISPDMKLILLGLILIKSFGDNSFDLTQRDLLLHGFPTTIFTCDFTLYLSVITSGMESSAVLTTNTRPIPGGPTGNSSTRFSQIELTPEQELFAIFESCMFENYQYLRMLVNLYNTKRQEPEIPGIQIKLGSENKTINLWFLVTIIRAIQGNMERQIQIYAEFVRKVNTLSAPNGWKDNKEKILQLLKCYCKIVFPFINKNGIWTIFAQTTLTSNDPVAAGSVSAQFVSACANNVKANKDALKTSIDECLRIFREETKIVVSIGKINAQQYALLVEKYFKDTKTQARTQMNTKLPVDITLDSIERFSSANIPAAVAAAAAPAPAPEVAPVPEAIPDSGSSSSIGGRSPDRSSRSRGNGYPQSRRTRRRSAPGTSRVDRSRSPGRSTSRSRISRSSRSSRSRSRSRSRSPIIYRSSEKPTVSKVRHKRTRSESSIERPYTHSNTHLLDSVLREFDNYIQGIGESTTIFQDIVGAGFPPKTLSGMLSSRASPTDPLIQEQQTNFKIITAILLRAYLSQLMILMNLMMTSRLEVSSGEAGSAMIPVNHYLMEISAQEKRCDEIIETLSKLVDNAFSLGEYVVTSTDKKYVNSIVEQFRGFRPTSSNAFDKIQALIERISSHLTRIKINPSMDTMEFAVSCLNFDIFFRCLTNWNSYYTFYATLQQKHNGSETYDYITKLHTGLRSANAAPDHSFFLYFYENIHNIAYNVYYNHEYVLPLDCAGNFASMVRHLINETDIPLGERVPVPVNPFEVSSQLTEISDSSQGYPSSSEGSTSPRTVQNSLQARKSVLVTGGPDGYARGGYDSPPSNGGSSHTRTHTRRRPTQKQPQPQKKQTRRHRRRRHKKRSGK